VNLNGKRVDLLQLEAELTAASILIRGLGIAGDDLHTYDADGVVIDVPVAAAAVVAAHVPPSTVVYSGEQTMTARVTTTGTTPAELFRATLRPLTAYTALVELAGVDSGNGAMRAITARIAAKRLNNGAIIVPARVGGLAYELLSDHADALAATWAVTPSVSGNDFVISVVGAAGREVSWFLRLRVDSFTPGGQP
jgi:hypothetical protein